MKGLETEFLGVKFENPFILGAAPSTDELDILRRGFEAGWAGAVLKTTSVPGTRVDIAYPMLASIREADSRLSLGNIDLISVYHVDEVARRIEILRKEFPEKVLIASIMGASREEWQSLVRILEEAGADMIECSFSCPQGNIGEEPGKMLAQSAQATELVTSWVVGARKKIPVLIKITPQVTDIVEIAMAVKRGGADGITASNTIPALMGIDIWSLVPNPPVDGKSTYSGLSGPAIKPITLRVIAEIARYTGMPIAGTGGAMNWRDAVEFMLVGAHIVQFVTAVMFHGFRIIDDLKSGLLYYMDRMGFESPRDIVGKSLEHIVWSYDELPLKKVKSRIDLEKCIGCGDCYISCRDGGHMAIEFGDDRKPRVIDEKCVGCALCKEVCPVPGCIRMETID